MRRRPGSTADQRECQNPEEPQREHVTNPQTFHDWIMNWANSPAVEESAGDQGDEPSEHAMHAAHLAIRDIVNGIHQAQRPDKTPFNAPLGQSSTRRGAVTRYMAWEARHIWLRYRSSAMAVIIQYSLLDP